MLSPDVLLPFAAMTLECLDLSSEGAQRLHCGFPYLSHERGGETPAAPVLADGIGPALIRTGRPEHALVEKMVSRGRCQLIARRWLPLFQFWRRRSKKEPHLPRG
jgi:hypothetical protein